MLSTGASTMPTLKEMRDDRPAGKRRSRLPASTGAGQMSERTNGERPIHQRSRKQATGRPAGSERSGQMDAIETDGHLMTDHQAPTIDQILAMKSGELHEWSRGGHTVVTPFGLGTVYNETFLDDQLDGLCVFLEDRSQAFYSREHGWETRDDYVTREEQERAAQRSRRRSRAR
jgi:hypothetical protein